MAILRTVKRFLRRAQSWIERRALAQLHARIDAIDHRLESMTALERRLGEVQTTVETAAARAAASIEYSQGAAESEAGARHPEDRGDRADARGKATGRRLTSPIRLAIDLQALQVDGYADRGIGRYVSSLSAALGRIGRVAGGLLAPELPPPLGLPAELAEAGLVHWDSMQTLRALMAGNEPVVHHVPAPFLHCGPLDSSSLVVSPHWEDVGLPRVVTLHDLIPLRAPHRYLPTPAHVERYRARATWVAAADLVLADSEFTRREAIELLDCDPDKVVNIGCGVSPYFTPSDGTDGEHFRFFLGDLEEHPFVLTISGSDIRKGTERLIAAVGLLVQAGFDLRLLVVGDLTPPWRARLTDAASSAGMNGRVVLAGSVGDELLRACYRRALVTVMPSVAEGFGLPVLESAACGTPALASATTALAEAAATALATFDPADTGAVSRAIADLLGDEDRRAAVLEAQRELAARSTWEVVAGKAAGAIDAMGATLGRSAWTAPPPPTRLALVGPLPPIVGDLGLQRSSAASACSRRGRRCRVTHGDLARASSRGPTLPHRRLRSRRPPVVVRRRGLHLGNSDGHLSTVESALRYPGWIWLHEVRLPAIAVTALDALDDDEFAASLGWLLERSYPGRAPTRAARRAGRSVQRPRHRGGRALCPCWPNGAGECWSTPRWPGVWCCWTCRLWRTMPRSGCCRPPAHRSRAATGREPAATPWSSPWASCRWRSAPTSW